MNLAYLVHSIYLFFSLFVTFFWVSHPVLAPYTLHLVVFFILVYLISHFWEQKDKSKSCWLMTALDSFIFILVVLLLVLSTGGLSSPLFFLFYFLLFALSLVWEPAITIVFTVGLISFFLYSYQQLDSQQMASILSLILISPLSLFFGQQYIKLLEQKGIIKILKKEVEEAKKDIKQEESNTLLWLSLNFTYTMQKIIDLVSQPLERSKLTLTQKNNLKEALRSAKMLLQTGKLLEEKIDRQTD